MANKITLQFTANPAVGFGFSYYSLIALDKIPYGAGGITDILITYLAFGDTETLNTDVSLGSTLSLTIDKTLQRLKDVYVSNQVSYSRAGNTIEVLINVDCSTVLVATNANITGSIEDVPVIYPDLKYFIKWDDYFLSIRQKNYQGNSTEIFGNVVLKKGSVDEILEPIRGTGLNIDLEANTGLTFDEFLLADEMTYTVELKKVNSTIFNGFIKPDGVQQSFVSDTWLVNIEVIDGLGALKDLSFVKSDGAQFFGKLSMFEIIKGCLDRTGSLMTINSSIELSYIGYAGTNILKDTYLNSSRFIKNDGTTIMDCNSVLTSVLNLLSAVITQENGQWWVYRPNDLKQNIGTAFINNTTDVVFTKNLDYNLGSQIDGYYPHHSESNQQIEVKGAISAYRLNYEYGLKSGIAENSDLIKTNGLTYTGWTVLNSTNIISNPLIETGITIRDTSSSNNTASIKSDQYGFNEGDLFSLKLNVSLFKSDGSLGGKFFKCIIRCGSYSLKYTPRNNETSIEDAVNAQWLAGTQIYYLTLFGESNVNVRLPSLPVDGDLSIEIIGFTPWLTGGGFGNISFVDFIPLGTNDGIVGEFHTVSRKTPPSSITKENQTVFNGDGTGFLIGSIYKSDQTTLTDLWARKDKFEQYPLLRISAEDDLRIKRNPIKVFSGSILGQFPYLSIININNIVGLFMFTEYTFDFRSKILNAKLIQFYNDELGDIEYLLTYDYGNNTIKPTIKG